MTAKRKRGAPASRLDAILDPDAGRGSKDTGSTRKRRETAAQEPAEAPKVKATFYLPADLLEQARDAVDALSGPPVRLRLNAMVADAIARELRRLERKHNEGEAFPSRDGATLRPGRAPK